MKDLHSETVERFGYGMPLAQGCKGAGRRMEGAHRVKAKTVRNAARASTRQYDADGSISADMAACDARMQDGKCSHI